MDCLVHGKAFVDHCPACRLVMGILYAKPATPPPAPGPCQHRGAVQEHARCPRNNTYDCLLHDEDVTEEPIGKTARNCRDCRKRGEDRPTDVAGRPAACDDPARDAESTGDTGRAAA